MAKKKKKLTREEKIAIVGILVTSIQWLISLLFDLLSKE